MSCLFRTDFSLLLDALVKPTFNLFGCGGGMLSADSFAGNIARQFMQLQDHSQPLFPGHVAIAFNLFSSAAAAVISSVK
jgi:hypothetical protein